MFINGKEGFRTFALLDSGADITSISPIVADELGINWRSISPLTGGSVNGSYSLHPITSGLEIAIYSFRLTLERIDVVEGLSEPPCLLGQLNLFDNAEIIFRRYQKIFEINPRPRRN